MASQLRIQSSSTLDKYNNTVKLAMFTLTDRFKSLKLGPVLNLLG